jgi:hypothetical protein
VIRGTQETFGYSDDTANCFVIRRAQETFRNSEYCFVIPRTQGMVSYFEDLKKLFRHSKKATNSSETRSAQETVSLNQRAQVTVPKYGGEAVSLFGGYNKLFCNPEGTINCSVIRRAQKLFRNF